MLCCPELWKKHLLKGVPWVNPEVIWSVSSILSKVLSWELAKTMLKSWSENQAEKPVVLVFIKAYIFCLLHFLSTWPNQQAAGLGVSWDSCLCRAS